jgi:hypothetical protein
MIAFEYDQTHYTHYMNRKALCHTVIINVIVNGPKTQKVYRNCETKAEVPVRVEMYKRDGGRGGGAPHYPDCKGLHDFI